MTLTVGNERLRHLATGAQGWQRHLQQENHDKVVMQKDILARHGFNVGVPASKIASEFQVCYN